MDAEWQRCLQVSPGPDIHSQSTSRPHASPSRLHTMETMGWDGVSGLVVAIRMLSLNWHSAVIPCGDS